jgi:hypothetical protein
MDERIYELYIDVYTPETIPLGRLSEYLGRFSELLGNDGQVHLESVAPGSVRLRAIVEEVAEPKVRGRVDEVRFGKGPKAALVASQAIDELLATDNAVGHISRGGAELIVFPGRQRSVEGLIGPVEQAGTLDGEVIQIGGKDESINVHLKCGGEILKCVTTKAVARRLASHIFGSPVRVAGKGIWARRASGGWELKRFSITEFATLDETPLSQLFEGLRDRLAPPEAGRENPALLVSQLRGED